MKKYFPKISIITPSFNQANYLEETILSVLNQDYPNLEYLIVDGGSRDGSVDIIKKYEKHIDYWVSEPDNGQSHAINKGFEKATGDLGNWICSDDLLCEGAMNQFAEQFNGDINKLYIAKGYQVDEESRVTKELKTSAIENIYQLIDLPEFWRGKNRDSILQQSVLFPVQKFKEVGGLEENKHFTMDYKLWGKLLLHGVEIQKLDLSLGKFRWYAGQKTSFEKEVTKELIESAFELIKVSNLAPKEKKHYIKKIKKYKRQFNYHQWRSKLGIKRRLNQLTQS